MKSLNSENNMKNYCMNHPDVEAINFCHSCKEFYCQDCISEGEIYYYCKKNECEKKLTEELETHKERVIQNIAQDFTKWNSFMYGHSAKLRQMTFINFCVAIVFFVLSGQSNLGFMTLAFYAIIPTFLLFVIPFIVAFPTALVMKIFKKESARSTYIKVFRTTWLIWLIMNIIVLIGKLYEFKSQNVYN